MHHEPAQAYLIADGARARLLLRHGDGRYAELATFEAASHHHSSHGAERSEAETERERSRFAAELAAALDGFVGKGAFDRLVLVAPPRILSAIRGDLKAAAKALVTAELAKDLTQLPEARLREVLDELVLQPLQ